MTGSRWERVKEIVAEALRLPAEERQAYLEEACGEDADLLAETLGLIRASESADSSFLESPPSAPAPAPVPGAGRHVLGEFELLQEIGRGAMGVVYLARQSGLDRTVAVKVLSIGLTTTQRQLDRFRREAQAAARLKHPGIVPVFTTGRTRDAHYFAMEYVPGGNLATELRRQRKGEPGLLTAPGARDHVQSCARAVVELADALAYSHAQGIVHRDVKPPNILIGEKGELRLVDFGLAKDESLGSLSRSGEVAGTPHYMSPEQALAKKHAIDHRTDVFSLGVVLYEMLTLERPFQGESTEAVLSQILHTDPLPVRRRNPRVPRDLAIVCSTAMQKDLRDRYASAGAFAEDLRRFLRFESIEARSPGLIRRTRVFARRHALGLTAGLVLLVGLTAGAGWTTRAMERREHARVVEGLVELDGKADWDALEDEELRDGRVSLAKLDAATDDERALQERMTRRFDELRRSWRDRALERIEAGRRAGNPEEVGGVDDSEVLAGFLQLTRALKIFPEDPELFALVRTDTFHPRVTIRAEDDGGRSLSGTASYRQLDQVTGLPGDPVPLGSLPIEELRIPPGFYRFVVEPDGAAFHEFTRLLRRAEEPAPIVCRVRADHDPTDGMVPIAEAVLENHADPPNWLCPLKDRPIRIASFLVDPAEVSNAEYRRFLQDTGRAPPSVWQWLPDDAAYDDRPVVGVTWFDALSYAEWAGKRLLSHGEWELAARGPSGAAFPSDPAPGADPYAGLAVLGPAEPWTDVRDAFERYLLFTAGVRDPAARGRNGLYHMLGNVYEWTEDLGYDRTEGRYTPLSEYRLLLGSWWEAKAQGQTLSIHKLWGPGRSFSNVEHGIRCARSLTP